MYTSLTSRVAMCQRHLMHYRKGTIMITVNNYTNGTGKSYSGVSTDSKPTTGVQVNDLFLELDTGEFYYWGADSDWHKVGAGA